MAIIGNLFEQKTWSSIGPKFPFRVEAYKALCPQMAVGRRVFMWWGGRGEESGRGEAQQLKQSACLGEGHGGSK